MKGACRACAEAIGGHALRASVPKTGKKLHHGLLSLVLCAALCGASAGGVESSEPQAAPNGRIEIVYPADGSVFPPDIIAPTFRWQARDAAAGPWRARLRDHEGRVIASRLTSEPSWRPDATEWEEVKRRSVDRGVVLSVAADSPSDATPAAEITLHTAREPVGDALFYREVPLPFLDAVRDPARIRWRYGTIDMEEGPPVVLENLPVFPGDAIVEVREEFLDPYSFLRAGTANQRTGDQVGAERSFRRGLELAPDDPGLHAALGWTLFQTGRPAEAATEYRRALAVSPDDAKTHNNLALALLELGDLSGAGEHFTRSLAIEPRCEVYADFGLLQDLLGREDLARESYEKGIALDPTCAAPRMNLASMLIEDGQYEEAAFHYRKAIEGKPSAAAHSGLGFCLNQLGRLDEAAAEHDAAVALDANLAEVHRNRALTQARLGNYEEAILSYRRAIAIEPRVSTFYSLAGVLRSAGRNDEAEAEYRLGGELSRRQQTPRPPGPTFPPPSQAEHTAEPTPSGDRPGVQR